MSEAETNIDLDYVDACAIDDLWDGEMETFDVLGRKILLVKHDGQFFAYQSFCPHQAMPLIEGKLVNGVLTCRAHLWEFDVATGKGINPSNCRLRRFPVRILGNNVQIGPKPIFD
jgi:nitrite reductase/ring-hydroxylating ferredoxin subunit